MKYLEDSKYIFLSAILLAFLLPRFADVLQPVLIPAIILMMTLSIKDVGFHHITRKNQIGRAHV